MTESQDLMWWKERRWWKRRAARLETVGRVSMKPAKLLFKPGAGTIIYQRWRVRATPTCIFPLILDAIFLAFCLKTPLDSMTEQRHSSEAGLVKMYRGSNSKLLSSHLQGKKLAQSYVLHVVWCSLVCVLPHITYLCFFVRALCSSVPCWSFSVQHSCQSECGPDRRTVCSTAVIPWAVPLQSWLSTWPQCLGCFQTTNWKCFLVS